MLISGFMYKYFDYQTDVNTILSSLRLRALLDELSHNATNYAIQESRIPSEFVNYDHKTYNIFCVWSILTQDSCKYPYIRISVEMDKCISYFKNYSFSNDSIGDAITDSNLNVLFVPKYTDYSLYNDQFIDKINEFFKYCDKYIFENSNKVLAEIKALIKDEESRIQLIYVEDDL